MSTRHAAALLLTLMTALLIGCGGGTGIANNQGPSNNSGTMGSGLSANTSSVNFGNVPIGSPKTESVTLTNGSTSQSVTVSQLSITGSGFSVSSSLTLPFTIAAGNSTTLGITFSPEKPANATGTLSVVSDSSEPPLELPLSGDGLPPGSLTATPSALNLGSVAVGSTGSGSVVVTNLAGGQSVTVSQVSVTGSGFSLTSALGLPLVLAAGQSTSIGIAFAASGAGSATGSLSVVSNATNPNLDVDLSATGVAENQLVASPASLNLGTVALGSTATGTIMVSNPAGPSITVSQLSVTGNGFTLASAPSLPLVLTSGQSVNLAIMFAPLASGSATGSLVVTSNASDSSLPVGLSGTGLASGQLGVSPSNLAFGNVTVGSSSVQMGMLTAGSSSLTVSSANWSGQGFSVSGINFPVTVSGGQGIPFTVTFAPTVAGNASGGVSFVSNAANSPTAITFTGVGIQPVQHSVDLSWDASQSQVAGYNVYRGTTSGGPYPNKLTSSLAPGTNYTDSTVQSGTTYYYVSTGVDSNGVESAYSNQTVAAIP